MKYELFHDTPLPTCDNVSKLDVVIVFQVTPLFLLYIILFPESETPPYPPTAIHVPS